MTTTDLQFNAVLAKNMIAEQMGKHQTEGINVGLILECLNDIEKVIGTANQPTVEDTFNFEY